MNPKIRLAIIIGLLASSFAGTAQNTPPAAAPAAAEQTVGTPAAETNAPAVVTAPATAQPGTILPLIVMDEVSLREAIRNLARGAGLNYMLDPRSASAIWVPMESQCLSRRSQSAGKM